MTAGSWRRAPKGSVAMRWLWRRLVVAYTLCPMVTALIVVVGQGHRVPAVVLVFTVFVATHLYVLACGAWALVLAPTTWPGATGPFWDDTVIVGLLALPALVALSRFTDEPTRTAGMAAVCVVLVVMFIHGYRNGFAPPEARAGATGGTDEPRN